MDPALTGGTQTRAGSGVRAKGGLAGERTAHLNILADHYGAQQHKVRALVELVELVELPLDLALLRFNAANGRVALAG